MGIEIGIGAAAKDKPLAVGIDLGTTNSLVAYVKDGRPVVIPGPNGSTLVPSVASFQADNLFIGSAAKKYQLVSNGEKKATPSPPSVSASSTACDAVQKKR